MSTLFNTVLFTLIGEKVRIENNRVFRLIRNFTDRRGKEQTRQIGVYTSLKKAQQRMLDKIIEIACQNITTATTVKGAIRGNGVATVHMLRDEVKEHGLTIESIHVSE